MTCAYPTSCTKLPLERRCWYCRVAAEGPEWWLMVGKRKARKR